MKSHLALISVVGCSASFGMNSMNQFRFKGQSQIVSSGFGTDIENFIALYTEQVVPPIYIVSHEPYSSR